MSDFQFFNLDFLLTFQLQHNPWATSPQIPYSMQNSTCMASQSTVPNFMGLAHPSHLSSYPVSHQPTMSLPVSQSPPLDPCENSERRSTSIAALRLKAHEHGVAMGIFGAYGKWQSMWSKKWQYIQRCGPKTVL